MISGILTIIPLSFVTPILSTSTKFLSMFGGDDHVMKAEMEERVVNQRLFCVVLMINLLCCTYTLLSDYYFVL